MRSLYVYEPDNYAPLARIDSDLARPERPPKRYYFHTDQVGTPQELTDAEGQVVWRAYYKAWGGLEALSPNVVEQNLRFQGQYHDRETGLHYNTFRYYDPVVGRFTTQDPIGLAGGINLYQYAVNPLGWIDPLGLAGNNILFGSVFWKEVGDSSIKTKMRVKGAQVFEVNKKVSLNGIKKGDYFHLDTLHLNEIEVYDSKATHKAVYGLDGKNNGGAVKGRSCG